MIISLIFTVLAAIGAGNMDFHDSTDGRIKSEQNIQALRGEELSYAHAVWKSFYVMSLMKPICR